ncbi:MAG: transposase [Candidatus Doudnabacteria bacterium]|nr:transposase [Candidatus Doudnabacteria bacterium]
MSRIIGIRHRVKKTKDGEARPTQVVIASNGETVTYDLVDENDELDFVLGRFPVRYRKVAEDEDLSGFIQRQVRWRKLDKRENREQYPANLVRQDGKTWHLATHVPIAFDGFQPGDTAAMVLGGSGDNLAYALSRRGEAIGAKVLRIPPFHLKAQRGDADRKDDALLLTRLAAEKPELFYETGPRDRHLISIREAYRARKDVMKQRIACEQRIFGNLHGQIFRNDEGHYPEGAIEDLYNRAKANDTILQNLLAEETRRERELAEALESFPVYQQIFAPIEECGIMTAARLIGSIIDIRRFATKYKLVAFCGAHVMADGRFPRRRSDEVANWNPEARQALYLLGDQWNRRPGSYWGQKLLANKSRLKQRHPEPLLVDGVMKYTAAHLHRTALWRTGTQFVRHLYGAWWAWQRGISAKEDAA